MAALLEHLQPDLIVVEGDPVETTTLNELMREHQVPGVSIAVIRNGKIDWARGFGFADVETGRAVTPQTLFQAASISKPVAAAAALSMVQDGLLDLDEDVNLKLKSWKLPTNEFTEQQPVTLRHLLSHTAGITVHGFPGYARDAKWPSTIDILEGRGNTPPIRVDTLPGSNWRYSGGGYTIIGQLMEDVAGKPYPEILRERVLEPAGMKHSTYVQPLPHARESDAATAYSHDGSAVAGRYHNYPEIGAAGLWTTAEDLARFVLAIQQSRAGKPDSLLSPRLIEEMLTPGKGNWGLGPALSEDGDRFGHGGANEGFRTNLSASLDDGGGIVVLTNGDGGGALCELVRMAAAKAYGWSAYEPTVRKRVDIGEDALARLAGTYECLPEWSHARSRLALFPNMGTLEFKAVNGRLIADVPEGARTEGRVEFLPQSELQLMQRRNGRLMDFIVEDGQVTGFKFRGFEARRVGAAMPQETNSKTAQPADKNVDALLTQLTPDLIVVDGDPIEKTTLDELMREHHVPGVSIAVIRNGKIDWARGFGLADVETGREVTSETLFQAASITKPVTAAAALSMVQDGLLDLDEDVNLKLKSWKLPTNEFTEKQPVTLRHLLSHTAGTTVHGFPGYARDTDLPSMVDILEGRGNTDPVRVDMLPGSQHRYSGGGYTIVAQLMADVAGKPFPEVVKEHVLEPAGMKHSTYVQPLPAARVNDAATAYSNDGSAIEGRYHHYPGGGGLWTTAEDLARFALAIQQSRSGKPGSLLSSRLVKEMLTPVMENYGLGLQLSVDGNRFGHSGANAGYLCQLVATLDDGWGIVVMTNSDGGWPLCEQVPMAAAKAYGWSAFKPTVRKRVDIGEDALARLAGTYECLPEWSHARSRLALFPTMGTLEFKSVNGRLIADVPEGARTEGRVEFLPQSEFQVMQRRNGRTMDFIVEDGQVTGFKFRGFEARRVDE